MRDVRSVGSLLALVLLASLSLAFAEQKPAAEAQGKVEKLEKRRLDIKTAAGQILSFALDDKTVVQRAGAPAPVAASLKVGEPVSVESRPAGSGRVALKVRVGGAAQAPRYSCPMHPEVVSAAPGKCPKCGMFLTLSPASPRRAPAPGAAGTRTRPAAPRSR